MNKQELEPLIISADEMKKTLPGYDPKQSGDFHVASARLADKAYEQALKESVYQKVILLSGGSASGKTEYLSAYLMSEAAIVVDGTLPTIKGFEIKLKKAKRAEKQLAVYAVIPDDIGRAFTAFLHRDRKFSDEHFYRTHSQSRATLLLIAIEFPLIPIRLIGSHIETNNTLTFTELLYTGHANLVEYLKSIQYTEEEIIQKVT